MLIETIAPNQTFYKELNQLRETFHKYGRFNDANEKLDEITKYIIVYVFFKKADDNRINEILVSYQENPNFQAVKAMKEAFKEMIQSPILRDDTGKSLFDSAPTLNIGDDDNELAYLLLQMVKRSVDSVTGDIANYDLLNECFGHFVRDNFRNHIEDAQYMTPNEAVELICDIAVNDVKRNLIENEDFIVMDPCCGVGSFLSGFHHKSILNIPDIERKLVLVGQDKVERMARLSKMNMFLSDTKRYKIANGNSLVGTSLIDDYFGKVDLILTNPPFGARFSSSELKEGAKKSYSLLYDVILKNGTKFNSEVLFVDRCISLLKPGGKMIAVLPDSVISSAGLNSTLRHRIAHSNKVKVKAIIELPAETFAQAGTRTKTSILYLEKLSQVDDVENVTFVAQSEHIGFEVSTKKGATVKHIKGVSDLPAIFTNYINTPKHISAKQIKVLNKFPSCVAIDNQLLEDSSWTPNHYQASRIDALEQLGLTNEYNVLKLSELVNFENRRRDQIQPNSKCISVLHVSGEDLNYEELLNYSPKYPGSVCRPGDILLSKINPRIMRIMVVPEIEYSLTCSTEFEMMNSKTELSNHAIKMLLMLPSVQAQINALTSGTSSSHNRIKTADLADIHIPVPREGTELYKEFLNHVQDYEKRSVQYSQLRYSLYKMKLESFDLFKQGQEYINQN